VGEMALACLSSSIFVTFSSGPAELPVCVGGLPPSFAVSRDSSRGSASGCQGCLHQPEHKVDTNLHPCRVARCCASPHSPCLVRDVVNRDGLPLSNCVSTSSQLHSREYGAVRLEIDQAPVTCRSSSDHSLLENGVQLRGPGFSDQSQSDSAAGPSLSERINWG
jgi:hypothetical protein